MQLLPAAAPQAPSSDTGHVELGRAEEPVRLELPPEEADAEAEPLVALLTLPDTEEEAEGDAEPEVEPEAEGEPEEDRVREEDPERVELEPVAAVTLPEVEVRELELERLLDVPALVPLRELELLLRELELVLETRDDEELEPELVRAGDELLREDEREAELIRLDEELLPALLLERALDPQLPY